MSNTDSFYSVLGIAPSAEDFVITAVYRALVKKYHPDIYSGDDGAKKIRDINAAYEVLSDPAKRAAYDDLVERQGLGSSAEIHQNYAAAPIILVNSDTKFVVPSKVLYDRAVVNMLGVSQWCVDHFEESWGRIRSVSAADEMGMSAVADAAAAALRYINDDALALGFQDSISALTEVVFDKLQDGSTTTFSDLRYASLVLERIDQRRILRDAGASLADLLFRTISAVVDSLLREARRDDMNIEAPDVIERRKQSAQVIMAGNASQSLERAIASLQLSFYDNEVSLVVVLRAMLVSNVWEEQLSKFVVLVDDAGPENFFIAEKKRDVAPGSRCLVEKVQSLMRMNDEQDVVQRGIRAIQHALPDWWDAIGCHVLESSAGAAFTEALEKIVDLADLMRAKDKIVAAAGLQERALVEGIEIRLRQHCFGQLLTHWMALTPRESLPAQAVAAASFLGLGPTEIATAAGNSIAAAVAEVLGMKDLKHALVRLESISRVDAVLTQPFLNSYLASQNVAMSSWIIARAHEAFSEGNPVSLAMVRRAADVLVPTQAMDLLRQVALDEFARLLDAGPVDRPSALLQDVSQQWNIDAAQQWHAAVVDYFSGQFFDKKLDSSTQFNAEATQLMGTSVEAGFTREVYDSVCAALPFCDLPSPAGIMQTALSVLDVEDIRVTGPRPSLALARLKELLLDGISDFPGELIPIGKNSVSEIIARIRSKGFYLSTAGTIAVVVAKEPNASYVLTVNGIFTGAGIFHSYIAITDVEAVSGWTQEYVKYRFDDKVHELNKLGSMSVANFIAYVIRNGARLAAMTSGDEYLGLFAGRDPLAEVLLDLWAEPPQLVLVADKNKMLPGALAKPQMLTGLASAPIAAATDAASEIFDGPTIASEEIDFAAIILKICARYPGKGFGFGETIDVRKLQRARKAFPMPLELPVFGLIDATVLGSNETGLAITANGIYWRNDWSQESRKNHLSWSEFSDVQISQLLTKFRLGEGNFYQTSGSSYPSRHLNALLRSMQGSCRLVQMTDGGGEFDVPDANPTENDSLEAIIAWACNTHSGGAIPVGSNIVEKKLRNAQRDFPILPTSRVVGLIDCTVFGSNKVGVALCSDGIVWKNDWTTKSPRTSLAWSEIADLEIGMASHEVMFGDNAVVGLAGSSIKPTTFATVVKAIREAIIARSAREN